MLFCLFCTILGIVLPPVLIYTVGPKLAQQAINGAVMSLSSVHISSPQSKSADSSASIMLRVQGIFSNTGAFDAKLAPATLVVDFEGTQLGSYRTQKLSVASGGPSDFEIASQLVLTDLGVFDQFASSLISSSSLSWGMSGSVTVTPTLSPGITPTFPGISLRKDLTLSGFAGLQGVVLEVFDLSQSTPTEVYVSLVVDVQNPSIVAIDPFGDVSFAMYYKGSYMGQLDATNIKIFPGLNRMSMGGQITPENQTMASELFFQYLSGVPSQLTAVAIPASCSIPLYSIPAQQLSLTTTLTGTNQPIVGAIRFDYMLLTPVDNDTVTIFVDAIVPILNPLGANSPINVTQTTLRASMAYGGIILGSFETPLLPISNGTQPELNVAFTATVALAGGGTPFAAFVTAFLQNPSVSLELNGNMDVLFDSALGVLNFHQLPFTSTVTLQGFGGIAATVNSFDLPGDTLDGRGLIVAIDSTIENPTVAEMSLGDVEFLLLFNGTVIGTATVPSLSLLRGANSVSLSGEIRPAPEDLGVVGVLFSQYIAGLPSNVTVRGVSSSLGVAWLNTAVSTMEIATVLNGSTTALVTGLQIPTLDLMFNGAENPIASASLAVSFDNPFGISLNVTAMSMDSVLSYAGADYAGLSVPMTSARTSGSVISCSFAGATLQISDASAFSALLVPGLNNATVTTGVVATATATAVLAIGSITLTGLHVSDAVTLAGMNQLSVPPIVVSGLDVTDGSPARIGITASSVVTNPSSLTVSTGPLQLSIIYSGVQVSTVGLADFDLRSGANTLALAGNYTESYNAAVAKEFLSRYLCGQASSISLVAVVGSWQVPFLDNALSLFVSHTTLAGMTPGLIVHAQMHFNLITYLSSSNIPTNIFMRNPFSHDLVLTAYNFDIYHSGTKIGTLVIDKSSSPVTIPAGATNFDAGRENVRGILSGSSISVIFSSTTYLDVTGTVGVRIGSYTNPALVYFQNNVLSD
eukprot:TRINITY_DN5328_c0_g2_i1.p1 TRINITY_DN5328_c0_g2~~TRINITY_DN5328_c0_g2_i1.p1  ORF type:complete len:1056 (-),score=252.08 TRINITY_DN5328_c0_g2_i1:160-3093(-)